MDSREDQRRTCRIRQSKAARIYFIGVIPVLFALTAEFFERHWQKSFGEIPQWCEPWSLTGQGPVPNHDRQGCYCLFAMDTPIYIGLGAARGSGLYKDHGIGKRLYSHVLRVDSSRGIFNGKGFYMPREKWRIATHLRTIGFPKSYGYLAPALESFLLARLPHELSSYNRMRPGSTA